MSVEVRELRDGELDAWTRLVLEAPSGSVYATPRYLEALCEATGGRYRILAAFRGTEMLGGIGLYEESTRWGTVVSPRLLLFYNGIVVREYDTRYPSQRAARQLEAMSALEEPLRAGRYARTLVKMRAPLDDVRVFQSRGWTAWPAYTYVVRLDDLDAAWGRIDQNLRRLVRRCEKQGIEVSEDEDFDALYRLHLEVHRRKGAPLYLPARAFERYFRRLRALDLCRLFHARLPDGRAIASQLVLTGGHPVTHTVTAATDAEYLKLGASALLRWRVFRALAAGGATANDLTNADLGPVSRFKAQLGADLVPCFTVQRPDTVRYRGGNVLSRAKDRLTGRGHPAAAARETDA